MGSTEDQNFVLSHRMETERLTLRRFSADDAVLLVELDSDPKVMRYLTGGAPTPRRVIEDEILPRFIQGDYWAAFEKDAREFIGWFSLPPTGTPGERELGYRLRQAAWGKGYATEGARALIRIGFTELGAERIVAMTYQDNLASRRVMEKAGLKFVRSFRITLEHLQHSGTFDPASNELWEGEDVEYAMVKEALE